MQPGGPLKLDDFLPQNKGWYSGLAESNRAVDKAMDARIEAILEKQLPKRLKQATQSQRSNDTKVKTLLEANMDAIHAALKSAHGRIHGTGGAAEILEINPSTLRSKMRKLGMTTKGYSN